MRYVLSGESRDLFRRGIVPREKMKRDATWCYLRVFLIKFQGKSSLKMFMKTTKFSAVKYTPEEKLV